MKTKIALTVFLLVSVGVCACSVFGNQELRDYKKVTTLDIVKADISKVSLYAHPVIKLGNISLGKSITGSKISPEEYKEWFRSEIINAAKRIGVNIVEDETNAYDLELKTTLVKLDPGSVAGRFIAAELGLGLANVKIEAELVDKRSGDVVALFKESRSASANLGIDDFKGDAGPALVRKMTVKIASEIIEEIANIFPVKS